MDGIGPVQSISSGRCPEHWTPANLIGRRPVSRLGRSWPRSRGSSGSDSRPLVDFVCVIPKDRGEWQHLQLLFGRLLLVEYAEFSRLEFMSRCGVLAEYAEFSILELISR